MSLGAMIAVAPANPSPKHGIAMHGEPQLPPDFKHFPYVNPDAPQGGRLRLPVTGSFDSLNPFIIRGQAAMGIRNYVFEGLMARNRDEPFALYGLLAETLEVNEDRSKVTFKLRKEARFSDGKPLTAKDVLFSLKILHENGRPNHRYYYSKVIKADVPDDHTVTLHLQPGDRELVLILGLMPILPAHVFETRRFDETTLEPLVGSGPYMIADVEPGKFVSLRRNPDYWGKDLAVSRGRWNFDEVRYQYYRDNLTSFLDLQNREVDLAEENDPVRWSQGYGFADKTGGDFIREVVPVKLPKPLSAFVFNSRREIFKDKTVREALTFAFDFEWANTNLFHNQFERTNGYYDGSILSSIGRPASQLERALLSDAGGKVRDSILDGSYRVPVSDGSGKDRHNLKKALGLLKQAGWQLQGRTLVNTASGEAISFEMVVQNKEQEKIALHYQRSLKLIGIAMSIRLVDSAQFQRRLQTYDFDMLPFVWFNSLSPGNEQHFYWGSAGRTQEGTRNYMGIAEPAIDRMIDQLLKARDQKGFVATVRALDRLLIEGHYLLPLYHAPGKWIGRWKNIQFPKRHSLYGLLPETGWAVPGK